MNTLFTDQYTKNDFIALIAKYLKSKNAGKPSEIEKEAQKVADHLIKRQEHFNSQKTKFTFIDLFAGIGGVRLGFEGVGGKCILTSEVDPKAQATYFCNFGEIIPDKMSDITKIDEKEIPNFDILLGGFPCQAFSVAGERKGFKDTRGTLFFDIERIIEHKKPRAFLLENVKGLLSHDNGKTFQTIKKILEQKLNYTVFEKVLNTMEYGNIPQTRERIYIVGFAKDSFSDELSFNWPSRIALKTTISKMLEKKQSDESLYYERFDLYKDIKKEIIKSDTIYQWRRVYVRENKSNACPTLTANMGTGGHNVPLIKERDSGRIRKLSPRECANFQGFPKDFYIPKFMSNTHLYKQFGNSVSVPVIQRIAEEMISTIEKFKVTKH